MVLFSINAQAADAGALVYQPTPNLVVELH